MLKKIVYKGRKNGIYNYELQENSLSFQHCKLFKVQFAVYALVS